MHTPYLERILKSRVYDVARETPLELAPRLSVRLGNRVWLKREDLQEVFSFKIRGAYNKMASLSPAELARGVVCSSAGNHAQGVALSAQRLGCRALIVMPLTTPEIKVEAVRARGAEVLLWGDSYSDAQARAQELCRDQDLVFVHPYDDPEVIAGQGTIGMEILRQHRRAPDAIFVPVGGGGLIAGIGVYVKALYPETRIVGVEPFDSSAMHDSLAQGRRVELDHVGLFADGVAVRQVGEETFRLAREVVDEMLLVDTDMICAAIKDIYEDTRSIMEPAGALALAGLKAWVSREGPRELDLVALACGANMNFDRLRHVAERAEIGESREALLAVTIPEQPGSFRTFCRAIGNRNITEFNYRYAQGAEAHVFAGIQVRSPSDLPALLQDLRAAGYRCEDFSGNEMAKVHLRHLVGGRVPGLETERLFSFEFPERPGALMRFLDALPPACNITLFHYRNHGGDIGRVLAGLQGGDPSAFLPAIGYAWSDETGNPAYRLFL